VRRAYDVAAVRAAEERAIADVGDEALMLRAAGGLAGVCRQVLTAARGSLANASVVLLVGAGNNGGDALFAGAALAGRGVRVVAVPVAETWHQAGMAALRRAGGRLLELSDDREVSRASLQVREADLVLDGIVGIGGSGPVREPAATLVRAASAGDAFRVAVDVPSGVDPDTGAVPDADAVFTADLTVTFGCLKPGLVTAPGRDRAGAVELIDIGLQEYLPPVPLVRVLQHADVAQFVRAPGPADHKYSRGVVGIVAGSERYPGAGLLTVGGARRSGVGMVRFAERGEGVAREVVRAYPDVVLQREQPAVDVRVSAWVVGPGMGRGRIAKRSLHRVLTADVPVVLDADALRLLADSEEIADQVRSRTERGALTVLTPHAGEFSSLFGPCTGGRVRAARAAAESTGCLIVLKGSGTVVAGPKGTAYVDPIAPHDLATAGSGDVLAGLMGGFLAHRAAGGGSSTESARCVAAAVYTHGLAARLAGANSTPVVATDLIDTIGEAIATLRRPV
jgi:hydroxyethylthiazole kinase-like uncharacterized protein yjeF